MADALNQSEMRKAKNVMQAVIHQKEKEQNMQTTQTKTLDLIKETQK